MCENQNFNRLALIVAFVVTTIALWQLFYGSSEVGTNVQTENSTIANNETNQTKKQIIEHPSCPISYLKTILHELCLELFEKHEQCTPDDFNNIEKHKPPRKPAVTAKNNTGEPRGTIVGCVAAGLLLTSLGAAFVELYKAKSQPQVKSAKPPLTRKVSLADLTVLKHNRRELGRRDSILELPESGSSLKQLGFRPPPLYRRCSFPTGPSEYTNPATTYAIYAPDSRRTSVESRRLSIIPDASRRNSTVDSRKNSIDGRRVSMDESPERRHWSRLVHRH